MVPTRVLGAPLLFFLLVILLRGHASALRQMEAVDLAALDGTEDTVAQSGIFFLERGEQLLHLLPLRVFIGGTGGFDDRQLSMRSKIADILFRHIQHGANDVKVDAREIGHGLKAADSSLKKQVEA